MPAKMRRKWTYEVNGIEYDDQKEAAKAVRSLNRKEMAATLAAIIRAAPFPETAAEAIMEKFYVFNINPRSKPHASKK